MTSTGNIKIISTAVYRYRALRAFHCLVRRYFSNSSLGRHCSKTAYTPHPRHPRHCAHI